MVELEPRKSYVRARRQAEKVERRASILAAAAELLPSQGFEGFSMAALARATGIAKGTLYLYFETREELLLDLYVERLEHWSEALHAHLRPEMTDQDFVQAFQQVTAADPVLTTLAPRVEGVLEHNVSVDCLVLAKRTMQRRLEELTPRLEESLALPSGSGTLLVISLMALSVGASQSKLSPVEIPGLPRDVRDFMCAYAETDVFALTAPMILAGLRGADAPT